MFTYIIKADGYMAIPVKSELNFLEFKEYFNSRVQKIHPKGSDTIYKMGSVELINPKVMMVRDFTEFMPLLM